MSTVLIKVTPITESVPGPDGSPGWRQTQPDPNAYNLLFTLVFTDSRFTTPLAGFTDIVGTIAGDPVDIARFITDNPGTITKITAAQAGALATTMSPARTVPCSCCGKPQAIPKPTIPAVDVI